MPKLNRNANPDLPGYKAPKESRYGRASAGGVVTDVSLPIDDARAVVAAINAVLDARDAIMFARTSGGGILAITVYSQGCDPAKFYPKSEEEATDVLADIENAARG